MRNSIDYKLIDEVAQLWIDNGGDLEGYIYCMEKIKDRIHEIQEFEYEQQSMEISSE